MSRLRRFIQRTRREECGIALVLAIGAITALSATVVVVIDYTTRNSSTSAMSKARNVAYSLAEAGLNNAYSQLQAAGKNALDPNLLSQKSATYAEGTATWSGVLDQSTGIWDVTAVGTVRNPTGAKATPLTRTLKAQIPVNGEVIQQLAASNQIWNWLYSTNTNGSGLCDQSFNSDVNISSPLYISGNLCLANGAVISGTSTKLAVGGYLQMANTSNYAGQLSAKLADVHVVNYCKVGSTTHNPCVQGASPTGDQIWSLVLDRTMPALTVPTPDWTAFYANANPGPKYPCYAQKSSTPSSNWPVFDNNTVRDTSVTTSFDLTPSTLSYDCWTDGGEIKWDLTTKTLTVWGTVFIDGHAKITCCTTGTPALAAGQGTLYLSGTLLVSTSAKFCGKRNAGNTDCDFSTPSNMGGTGWDPNLTGSDAHFIVFVTGGSGGQTGVSSGESAVLVSNSHFQGGILGVNKVSFASGVSEQGPIIAGTIGINSTVQTYQFNLTQVQSGVPGQPKNYAQPLNPIYSSG